MSVSADARPLRVLITNRILLSRTGTEIYTRDLALGLLARGHRPVVYSPLPGGVAQEIRAHTVPVTSDLANLSEPPDIIHGHQALETLAALLAFPGTPAVAFCHSWIGWPNCPARFPRIRRYIAVDHTCRDRLCQELGIAPAQVRVLLNAVDVERFRRRTPLPPRPRRALVFSNAAGARHSHLDAVQRACAAEGIEVQVMGAAAGRSLARPEEVLRDFDLVFAKAKAALEALATGTAVILCDYGGAGPLVTTGNLRELRLLNFGMRALQEPITAEVLRREIARYDAADAEAVCREIRETANHDALVEQLCAIYEEVIGEQRAQLPIDSAAELRAAAAYLQRLAPLLYERDLLHGVFRRLLQVPGLGRALRAWARRTGASHWTGQLRDLGSLD